MPVPSCKTLTLGTINILLTVMLVTECWCHSSAALHARWCHCRNSSVRTSWLPMAGLGGVSLIGGGPAPGVIGTSKQGAARAGRQSRDGPAVGNAGVNIRWEYWWSSPKLGINIRFKMWIMVLIMWIMVCGISLLFLDTQNVYHRTEAFTWANRGRQSKIGWKINISRWAELI